MNIKNAFHFCLLAGCLLVKAHPQEAKVETFWVGRTLESIKERPITSAWTKDKDGKPYHYLLKDGFMMAGLRPTPAIGVLVRGKTCYVFDIGSWPDEIRNLPLRHGDKLFYYRDRTELGHSRFRSLRRTKRSHPSLNRRHRIGMARQTSSDHQ